MSSDSESDEASEDDFDPFGDRPSFQNSITDEETLSHVFKSALGTGILSMPIAFLFSGLYLGVLATLLTGLICTHCAYVLVQCAHRLYYKERVSKLSYAEVTERVFLAGPKCLHIFAGFLRLLILIGLFITYFGACCVNAVTVAENCQQIWNHWAESDVDINYIIVGLLIPLVVLSWSSNLKSLGTTSMMANIFMMCSLFIACYYFLADMPADRERNYMKFSGLPVFFSITIFAMQAIGIIMPLENCMQTPTHFLGWDGVLVQAMAGLTVVHMVFGYMGYLCHGPKTDDNVILNLPVDELPAQLVSVMIAIGVYCTFGLQLTVCREIAWDAIKAQFTDNAEYANYALRTILVIAAVVVAVAVPTIGPFIGLLGAFFLSILGLIIPVVIETIMDFEDGFGMYYWVLWKNIAIITFGVFALIFGSKKSFKHILALYDENIDKKQKFG